MLPSGFQASNNVVVAEVVIEPRRWSELSFNTAGHVAELLVQPGDHVEAGAPLLRLDAQDIELELQSAQEEVVAQQAALDEAARSYLQQAEEASVELHIAELQLKQAEMQSPQPAVAAAQSEVEQLRLQWSQQAALSPSPQVTAAEVSVERAQTALDAAQAAYDNAHDPARDWEPNIVNERAAASAALQETQYQLELAQAELSAPVNARSAHSLGLAAVGAQIDEAEAELLNALNMQAGYTVTLDILDAQVQAAQIAYDNLSTLADLYTDDGSDDQSTEAEARLRIAELAVQQLQLQFQESELRAPFSGTVVEVRAEVGEQVKEGEVVIVLATLDQLIARTSDLLQLDVAKVSLGQPVVLSVDAVSNGTLDGVVRQIALKPALLDDEVVYPVLIDISESDLYNQLRWGMTGMAQITVDE